MNRKYVQKNDQRVDRNSGEVRKQKYTRSQRIAYHSGRGYRVAYEGKSIPFKNEVNKDSFRAGWKAAAKCLEKYPDLSKKRASTKKRVVKSSKK